MSTKGDNTDVSAKEISDLTKKRSSYKGRITILSGFLKSLDIESITLNQVNELEKRIGKLESMYAQFDETQTRLECISDDLDSQLSEREEFENRYYKVICEAQEIIENNNKKISPPEPSECSSHSGNNNKPVKLPTIQLPTFSGSYDNWLEFRDTFVSLIHSNDEIDIINKYHYLRTCLKGSAAVVINTIQFSASNYNTAWRMLCDRFDNTRLLIKNHISAIFNIDPVTRESSSSLKHLMDQLNKNLSALESLGESTDNWDMLLIHIITQKLDPKSFHEWERYKGKLDTKQSIKLKQLHEFMQSRTDLLESIELSRQTHNTHSKQSLKHKTMISMDSGFYGTQTPTSISLCPKCNGDHKLNHCPQFLALSNEARLQLLPSFKVCFNCFHSGHYANHCKKTGCKLCKRRHNTLIHVDTNKSKPVVHSGRADNNSGASPAPPAICENNLTLSTSITASSREGHSHVLLSTALIKLYDLNNREHIARALLDSGSTSCLMTKELYHKLNLPYIHTNNHILGINNVTSRISKMCDVPIKSLDETFATQIRCFVLPTLTGNVPSSPIDLTSCNIPSDVCLADPNFCSPAAVDLILGADIFWDILGSQRIDLGAGKPILCETRLGWIVSGPIHRNLISESSNSIKCNFAHIDSFNEKIQHQLSRFWSLEEVNVSSSYSPEHKLCEEHFKNNTTRLGDGRFCVRIPLKENPSVLGNSLYRAKQCFYSLERRLISQPKLYKMYREFMTEYEMLGHMSECKLSQEKNAHFIPHHGVLRESSTTTKLRAVFNASNRTSTGVSLNSIQLVGPIVQDDLLSILLRFRQHKYVLMADVEKMYRCVATHPDDRFLQQIVWRDNPNDPLKAFQLNTVTYGTASAPFLATRCLKQVGLECDDKRISEIIIHDFYVDDLLSGGDDLVELQDIRKKLTSVLLAARFPLRKWQSNEPKLVSESTHCPLDLNIGGNEPSKTLGLGWHTESDELCFPISTTIPMISSKRNMLSIISQIFDPLGLVSPVVISMKMLLQRLWLNNLSWDEPLPSEIEKPWVEFVKKLHYLNKVRVPRRIIIDSHEMLEFHIFVDASEKAYGACLYVRSIDAQGQILVRLLMAKSRVAPIKATTIPRLELCGALVGARLYEKVINSLRIKAAFTVFWTDSTILLGWLKMLPCKLHTFVRNRVGEILEKTGDCVWRHVPTEHNPADYISRGVGVETIQSLDTWWSGPSFLQESSYSFPSTAVNMESLPETRNVMSCIVQTGANESLKMNEFINFNRFSSFSRLRRAIAYMLRFINACRRRPAQTTYLSAIELDNSLNVLIRVSQRESFKEYTLLIEKKGFPKKSPLLKFNVYLDTINIMRVGGRLENAEFSYNKKHPILLQSTHRVTKLLFDYEHLKLMHAGPQLLLASIREVYWPIGGRNLAKACYRRCIRCSRMKGKVIAPLMGNLPQQRLTPGFPFQTVGVDYAGPISSVSRQGRGCRIVKVYIALFICFTTKAIHLELVGDMTSNSYLLALRRFVARRGKPAEMYSDNGTTFIGAYNDLAKFLKHEANSLSSDLSNEGINFHFIPAYSPHFGGIWEAGVKSAKYHLVRVLGNCHLTYEELSSTLVQIEAILNSRPLTPLSSHPEDLTPLTPGHFLIGRSLIALPTKDLKDHLTTNLSRFQRIEQLRQHFWARWSKEYVSELQQRSKWHTTNDPLKIDALVLLKDDNLPPLRWKLGRIVALYPGSDQIARVADIKTSNGIVRRSFSKLCPLPISEDVNC